MRKAISTWTETSPQLKPTVNNAFIRRKQNRRVEKVIVTILSAPSLLPSRPGLPYSRDTVFWGQQAAAELFYSQPKKRTSTQWALFMITTPDMIKLLWTAERTTSCCIGTANTETLRAGNKKI